MCDSQVQECAELRAELDRAEAALRELEERLERASLAWLAFSGGRDANGMELMHAAVSVGDALWNRHQNGFKRRPTP